MTNRFSGRWNRGQASVGAIMYELLLSTPLATATLAVVVFMRHLSRHSSQPLWCPVQGPQQILSHSRSFGNKSTTDLKDSTHISEKIFCPKGSAEIIGWPEDKDKCRKVLIATLEYEIFDGNLKVEIVKDTEHPAGEPGEPIEVVIFGEPYLIEVETHAFDNITYVLLDSPISTPRRNHTRIPLAWMISVQQPFIRRGIRPSQPPLVGPPGSTFTISTTAAARSLLSTSCPKSSVSAFNISKDHCTKCIQFGNTFNLLHTGASASYISYHRQSDDGYNDYASQRKERSNGEQTRVW
ncbi:hypothetical protein JVT61DRAFT_9054 [Boletus reticuloceps]|uniref:Uncharacterized protein n=1 Tax=Boletus reticuloceps TaxID=495285 RepID=A0A8I2YGW9_9AGAM|nr:hypothetical protein JVT61DRAFT_9054 [Boletus reticuloceps]